MITMKAGAVLAAAMLAVSGCGGDTPAPSAQAPATGAASAPAGDRAAVCARWKESDLRYLLHTAPEAKAWAQAVADSYQGKAPENAVEIEHAYFSSWATATRPLVAQAADPEVRAALTEQVAELDRRAAASTADYAQQPPTRAMEVCR
jgi:hypothetical protein